MNFQYILFYLLIQFQKYHKNLFDVNANGNTCSIAPFIQSLLRGIYFCKIIHTMATTGGSYKNFCGVLEWNNSQCVQKLSSCLLCESWSNAKQTKRVSFEREAFSIVFHSNCINWLYLEKKHQPFCYNSSYWRRTVWQVIFDRFSNWNNFGLMHFSTVFRWVTTAS